MGLFPKRKQNAEKIAMRIGHDGVYCASLRFEPAQKPILDFLSFYPGNGVAVQTLLERVAKETPAKSKEVGLLLNHGEYQILALEAMNVPDQELRSAVKWRVKEMLDFPIAEASIDVIRVPGDVANAGRNQSLMAIVARNTVIKTHQDQARAAKLRLNVIDIPEMAQRNLSARLETSGRGLAMLSFDAEGGLLTVTFGGELYLSRRFDINLDQLRSTDSETQGAVFERISLELQRSLDHFERQHNYITNAKLVLAPLGEVGNALRTYLASNVYLSVEILDLSSILNLDQIPELKSSEQQQKYVEIIGAALRFEGNAV
ncbi:MAG: agglutinin biogenesis protein MshI [Burkholderiaceae bacterium]|nr:MAG: agglutinin biogenesis protein MshI [Burkholderiaceae bacterium]